MKVGICVYQKRSKHLRHDFTLSFSLHIVLLKIFRFTHRVDIVFFSKIHTKIYAQLCSPAILYIFPGLTNIFYHDDTIAHFHSDAHILAKVMFLNNFFRRDVLRCAGVFFQNMFQEPIINKFKGFAGGESLGEKSNLQNCIIHTF